MAQNGDTILVSPGTYFESINFLGKAITVASSDGAAVTTIFGSGGPVVRFASDEGHGSVLRGFTITNGFSFSGAGIQISSASPVVENNVISGNQGCEALGIQLEFSSAIVRHNTISNNTQAGCGGSAGGALEL
jgi:parallel beta-helix repeat protein